MAWSHGAAKAAFYTHTTITTFTHTHAYVLLMLEPASFRSRGRQNGNERERQRERELYTRSTEEWQKFLSKKFLWAPRLCLQKKWIFGQQEMVKHWNQTFNISLNYPNETVLCTEYHRYMFVDVCTYGGCQTLSFLSLNPSFDPTELSLSLSLSFGCIFMVKRQKVYEH